MASDENFDAMRREILIVQSKRLRRIFAIVSLVWLVLADACGVHAQMEDRIGSVNTISISDTLEVRKYWRLREAGLVQQLTGTSGYIVLENVTGETLKRSVFYAEYFNSSDRFCFSLILSLERNVGDRSPVAAGETRIVSAVAEGLHPALKPAHVQVYLVRDDMSETRDQPPIQAPVTLDSAYPSSAGLLQLPLRLRTQEEPFTDLLSAKVSVNREGHITDTDILYAADPSLREWFTGIATKLSFYPATVSNSPRDSLALVDIVAIQSKESSGTTPTPAYDRPWVQEYSKLSTPEMPPITQLVFIPPAKKIRSPGNMTAVEHPGPVPSSLELGIAGSDWSLPNYEWIRDDSMPHHQTRKLIPSN